MVAYAMCLLSPSLFRDLVFKKQKAYRKVCLSACLLPAFTAICP